MRLAHNRFGLKLPDLAYYSLGDLLALVGDSDSSSEEHDPDGDVEFTI